MKEIFDEKISILKLDKVISNILNNNRIDTIYSLCNCSRMELVGIGLTNNQVNKIMINLQLQGLDLKPNHSKKNSKIKIVE